MKVNSPKRFEKDPGIAEMVWPTVAPPHTVHGTCEWPMRDAAPIRSRCPKTCIAMCYQALESAIGNALGDRHRSVVRRSTSRSAGGGEPQPTAEFSVGAGDLCASMLFVGNFSGTYIGPFGARTEGRACSAFAVDGVFTAVKPIYAEGPRTTVRVVAVFKEIG